MKDNPQLDADLRRELQIVGMRRTNLMLVGDVRAVRAALEVLWSDVNELVLRWRPGQPLDLPRGGREATLVLHDVGDLTGDEQARVGQWLDAGNGRIRIVSTSAEPLWPRVASGAFDDSLYYRLNTVLLEVGAWPQTKGSSVSNLSPDWRPVP